MVSEKYLIGGAVVISILIHLAALPLYDKFVKHPKPKASEPIEVSYLPPKQEPPRQPATPPQAHEPRQDEKSRPLPPIPDFVDNTNRETTFDENLVGGEKGVNKEKEPSPTETASLPKIKPKDASKPQAKPLDSKNSDTVIPADELSFKEHSKNEEKTEQSNETPKPNIAGLMDTRDIIERIANKKKEQPKGQDTASYNKFEGKYASYFAKFKNNVYQVWNYPPESALRGETGVVKVSFSILKDGSIVNIKLLSTSGYPSLDREVMRVLKNMRETPLPNSYELEQLNIEDANFIYTIGRGWDIF